MNYGPHFGSGIIDSHAYIGHWAFRRLRRNDVPGVVGMMDQFGIDLACVSSIDAILYRDVQPGNEKLFEDTRGHENRLCLYATINPAYPGWERALQSCLDRGFKAIRLFPLYHGYALDDSHGQRILRAAAEAKLPVAIPCRIEDSRQRHAMDTMNDIDPETILLAGEANPDTTLIVQEAIVGWGEDDDRWKRMAALRMYTEISRMTSVMEKTIPRCISKLGAERVLLGTGFPFKTPSPAFLKLQVLDAVQDVKDKIAGGNALHVFGLKSG